MTLQDMSERLEKSVGWLSQVERDLSTPSASDLRQIATLLDVPTSMLFRQGPAPAEEAGYVVRRDARRSIGARAEGLVEELLSPDLTDDFEIVHSTFAPGSAITRPVQRPTQEVGVILQGKLDLVIGPRHFTIRPGDSFRVRGEPFTWANPYQELCVAIWVIAPPVY